MMPVHIDPRSRARFPSTTCSRAACSGAEKGGVVDEFFELLSIALLIFEGSLKIIVEAEDHGPLLIDQSP